MANSVDPDQLASLEANWSGSTLIAKAGYIRVQQDKGWVTQNEKDLILWNVNLQYDRTRCHINKAFGWIIFFLLKTSTGLWNYQILLLVYREVNGQNPLVQPGFTCLKIDIFLMSGRKLMLWVLIRSTFCGVWSGSTLFAKAYLSQY